MAESSNKAFSIAEWLVLAIVLFATISFQPEQNEIEEVELSRCSDKEKREQINRLEKFHQKNLKKSKEHLEKLRIVALEGGNIFEELLKTTRYCSLGEISNVLFEIGGRYRRNV